MALPFKPYASGTVQVPDASGVQRGVTVRLCDTALLHY